MPTPLVLLAHHPNGVAPFPGLQTLIDSRSNPWGPPGTPPPTGAPAIVARPPAPLPVDPSGTGPAEVDPIASPGVSNLSVPVQGALPASGDSFATAAAAAADVLTETGPAGAPVWAWVAIVVLVLLVVR